MGTIQGFRDLEVYQQVRLEARRLYEQTHRFPREETYALSDQVRRSSRAVGALLAEAWGRRRYEAAFVNLLSQAIGEANETQCWLDYAADCGCLDRETHRSMDATWQRIGGKLHRMLQRADTFCR
jgi:four helix bundle protein